MAGNKQTRYLNKASVFMFSAAIEFGLWNGVTRFTKAPEYRLIKKQL
jgi:hypothetical protein